MLVTCPKCGFRQPQDQYCASCGVDMATFEPPKKSLLQIIGLSPFFHVALAALLVGGSIYYIRTHNQTELQERIAFLKGLPSAESAPGEPTRATTSTEDPTRRETAATEPSSAVNETSMASASNEPPPPPVAAPQTVTPPTAESQPAEVAKVQDIQAKPAGPLKAEMIKFKVTYGTLNSDEADRLVDESSTAPNPVKFGSFYAGIVQNIKQKISGVDKWQHFEVYENSSAPHAFDPKSQSAEWFDGVRDRDAEGAPTTMGLFHRVVITDIQNQKIKGDWEVNVSLREDPDPTAAVEQKPVYAFELLKEQAAYMMDVLPRYTLTQKEMDLFNNNFLRVMNNSSYRNRETHFLVLLEFLQ